MSPELSPEPALKNLLALIFFMCGLASTASAAFAAGHADRKGMYCIDVNALSARLQGVEDLYDAIPPDRFGPTVFRLEKARRDLW
jgi:hypothetical protein